jgi:ABC-type multidrug transport system ATPase subunit
VTFSLRRGEALGIVGANGSGKSTLLRLIVGLIEPAGGSATIDGLSIRCALSRYHVEFFGGWTTLPPTVTAAAWCALSGVAIDRPWADRRMWRLSPGLRQQAGLVAVLDQQALDLVVLDEPWESLDVRASRWLCERLEWQRAAGATLIVTSHRLPELLEVSSRIAVLSNGVLRESDQAPGSAAMQAELAARDAKAL